MDLPFNIEYVDESNIDKELVCSCCYSPFLDPVIHQTCGNTFCKKCIFSLESSACPLCRGQLQNTLTTSPRIVLNQLNGLKVYCPTCRTTLRRDCLLDHFQQCPVECPQGCKEKIAPKDLKQHLAECPQGSVTCVAVDIGCTFSGKRSEFGNHQDFCLFVAQRPLFQKIKMLEQTTTSLQNVVQSLHQTVQAQQNRIAVLEKEFHSAANSGISAARQQTGSFSVTEIEPDSYSPSTPRNSTGSPTFKLLRRTPSFNNT